MSDRIYTIEELREQMTPVFRQYHVKKAVLFGSYGKGIPNEKSDVDLFVDSGLKGLQFVGFMEDLRMSLNKEIDVFDRTHIEQGTKIDSEINNTGVLIYEE